ncbi:putative glutamate synthase [Vibrio nigripulchritudo SFn27]|uniref:Putative glutamate synthase n=1 Tax=Vibrio nigripulchritudo TaxID=28173 RepID=U4KAR0_9VIBR|nr:glutamate synthase-related protein [Vibrio nigripulchritudo]CCN81080.1 putative glutamate synthase [Vibrio nigripulchritudo BLFn1]CCN86532.1 putative glutamate synthase [Vibrio nigripulchritudo SFn27]CCN92894.1 putative glutamate synthase [Vibrio nigripulchritudo ENn2]CCO40148.1 putative glutamate synthase [Vibrio nigripulchritudo SFn135]CCO52387.1 putative glutamate synthase [Vibrio nigripulchritudo Wn13]
MNQESRSLYDREHEHSSCGVGFITDKTGEQTHQLLALAHEALCTIPHRGGMNAEGIGDGAGVNIDLSVNFYRFLLNEPTLEKGEFGVANFFFPFDSTQFENAKSLILETLYKYSLKVELWREVPVNPEAVNNASQKVQQTIQQVVFLRGDSQPDAQAFEDQINAALSELESVGFTAPELEGFYPLSMSSRTQVYKGRLNSGEVVPYFADLTHPEHHVTTLFFHTRFSTNTAPATMMAQPFRRMAHNGELNTDKKNRLSEDAIARQQHKKVIFPKGQSDSARLDQTLARRVIEDRMDIVTAVLAMMPPAWENDESISQEVRDMLEYFSLSEEKNDGPAALIFSDGEKVGARLDRLGLRPLRSVETDRYLAVMSESGQIDFPPEDVVRYGRIQAGGMIYFDHSTGKSYETKEILETLAKERNYSALLASAKMTLGDIDPVDVSLIQENTNFSTYSRHVAYSLNQESFKFFLDPMIENGAEKISAMGFGLAPNVLTDEEGGMSKYFSQRFAQVTNPPLDSLRESDGMTLRVALGAKPGFSPQDTVQLVLQSPVLQPQQLEQIQNQDRIEVATFDALYSPTLNSREDNAKRVEEAIIALCDEIEEAARRRCGIVLLTDKNIGKDKAALPAILMVAAANQRLIKQGLRFNTSIVYLTGQAASSHDIACLLGFGASAVCPISVFYRAQTLSNNQTVEAGLKNFQKAVEKSLMKTMGKFGLCTAESYIGGEFFESNFLDSDSDCLKDYFPNISSPVGGARFDDLAWSSAKWHFKALAINEENQIPLLGLFKERQDGAGHSFGNTAVREYINMTQEPVTYADQAELAMDKTNQFASEDIAYKDKGYEKRTPEQIDEFEVTPSYRSFIDNLYSEREERPAALRDILLLPLDFSAASTVEEFAHLLDRFHLDGNVNYLWGGITIETQSQTDRAFTITLDNTERTALLAEALQNGWGENVEQLSLQADKVDVVLTEKYAQFLASIKKANAPISLDEVEPAHVITPTFASGAMSHGALNSNAHIAVAQGTNIAGAMSNSGEGGEHSTRFNSIKSSKIKQFASGRFGVWVGYLADPQLEEIEIKIAQGAKPGEGGQLPSPKVTVEIAAARGGTPGVELVSPPPHHDTYSIEDLGQLIHDAKAARVRVIVKLVSSEGIGTIAVGVAKAGADVINVAGNTGGTGAAAVTSLKNTGRAAEIGIAEVHQSLSENGLRDKVTLRCSNAHQTGMDVIKSAIMGGDSFEFGTTALMMLKCVMAKNCNIKCPAGLTTNPELYQGDPRALAQYFQNVAHEVREILASLGFQSLREIRGKTELLHLANHHSIVGRLDVTGLLREVEHVRVAHPVYLEADFTPDDAYIEKLLGDYFDSELLNIELSGTKLNNRNKSTGGQLSIDIERALNYQNVGENHPAVFTAGNGRRFLDAESVVVRTHGSAGQSYGAFNNSGLVMEHVGTCNDGVGKGSSGGHIVVRTPGSKQLSAGNNVLIGNFALFGATGGQAFIQGEAGDRFAVRNSGAVAVVEGVGDFCCEYMTNGSVINLGSYGKGFGNGMSGGVAYQYDVDGAFANRCSKDSVLALPLIEHNEGYEEALKWHLEQHVKFTQSETAKAILADWATSRTLFTLVLPLALTQSQHPDSILSTHPRKKMLEELIQGEANRLIEEVHFAYEDNQPLSRGLSPQYGDMDTPLICNLLTQSGVLHRAHQLVKGQYEGDVEQSRAVKRLFELRDKKLLDMLLKDVKEAISNYRDEELAVLLAAKRVQDYKTSLARRDVWDTHSRGTTVWILAREQDISEQMKDIEAVSLRMATLYCHVFADVIRDDIEQQKTQEQLEAQTA